MATQSKRIKATKKTSSRRPPPTHAATLEDSLSRLGADRVTARRMFGGLCYYASGKPFAFVLGPFLALKLPRREIREASAKGEGKPFEPAKGFVMQDYLALSKKALEQDGCLDAYVLASYRFVSGQEEDSLARELRRGRQELYRTSRIPKRPLLPEW